MQPIDFNQSCWHDKTRRGPALRHGRRPEGKALRPPPLAILRARLLNSGPIGPLAIRDKRRHDERRATVSWLNNALSDPKVSLSRVPPI